MNKPDDYKMHPDDKRNLIIFGVLSVLLWLSYDHFILGPKLEQMRIAQEAAQQQAIELQAQSGMLDDIEVPRDQAIETTTAERIQIDNELLKGSINPVGARFDDLETKKHFKTVERVEEAVLLSPSNAPYPKYVEQGWIAADTTIKTPDSKSVWQKVGGDVLSNNSPVTLEWNNGQGLTFQHVIEIDDAYGFTLVKRVMNKGNQDVTLYPYGLIAERGIPEDFESRFVVHEGPIAYANGELFEATYGKMDDKPKYEERSTGGWVGLTTKSWLTALVPDQAQNATYRINYTSTVENNLNPNAKDRYQADTLGAALVIPAGGMNEYTSRFFVGAKNLKLIDRYEEEWSVAKFDLVIDWGWFFFLTKPFFIILQFFYGLVGNFGVAIIMLTIILRIAVFPLANTSFKSFANMRKIGPQMQELREKYNDDKAKLQQELVKLYQREKVNPMSGCLPILVQIPIFFSLFKVLSNTIEMRHAPFFGWIQDLSAPDPTSVFNLFGLLPFTPPDVLQIGIWPCLMLVSMIIQRKLSPPPPDKMQARMIAALPWIMTFILAQFAAGLVIYWTFNNIFSTIQQYIIMRRMGVEVDFIGNILGKNKKNADNTDEVIEGEATEVVEEKIADETPKEISKPKPKKSKKKK
ncbi:MAG: membrane protein insertase YidC [Pseudomonadota bacterium]